jgi:hypothetical protein
MDQSQLNKTNVQGPSIRLSTVATSTRQTPKTDFGSVMRDGLIKAGGVAVDGLRVAAPFVPGGTIISAAVAGAHIASGAGYAGTEPGMGGGGGGFGGGASSGGGYGGIATSRAGLSSGGLTGGAGPNVQPGTFGGGGTLGLPGPNPGIQAGANAQAPTSFSGTAGGGQAGTPDDSFNQMMSATRQMSEFQASFNLQYLQLQEKIQQDSRQFNLVSNIMKTKHDAAKNALNNVR